MGDEGSTPSEGGQARWCRLDLERIDDTSLAEGKKIRYDSFRRFQKKNPRDYVEIQDNKHHLCYVCYRHKEAFIALMADAWELPQENYTWHTLREIDNKTGVSMMYPGLGCVMCEAKSERESLDKASGI